VVSLVAALGASHPVMLAMLQRRNAPVRNRRTLCRAFREELRQGKENLITSLGVQMVQMATNDGPHSFSACVFLLRPLGGRLRRPVQRRGMTCKFICRTTGAIRFHHT
jgi:hypothetical protein